MIMRREPPTRRAELTVKMITMILCENAMYKNTLMTSTEYYHQINHKVLQISRFILIFFSVKSNFIVID